MGAQKYLTATDTRWRASPYSTRRGRSISKSLKMGKSAGVDNIPAEFVQAEAEAMIDILTSICNKIWKTGEWPTTWTQSLVITLPKKGNLQLCQNYRTISKVMLKNILNSHKQSKYNKPIRNTVFNFNKLVSDLDIHANNPESWDC